MVGLDTSVVLRLLVGEPATQAAAARRLLEEATEATMLSDLVVGETYFALRHHYEVPHDEAIVALRKLVADPRIEATGAAPDVLAQDIDARSGAGLMDRLIHGDYERAGASLLTFDRHAARLTGARLIRTS